MLAVGAGVVPGTPAADAGPAGARTAAMTTPLVLIASTLPYHRLLLDISTPQARKRNPDNADPATKPESVDRAGRVVPESGV
jgi:hypothetical protein